MAWPTDDIDTSGVDQGNDTPPRVEFLKVFNRIKDIIAGRGTANGICDLDASVKIPIARIPNTFTGTFAFPSTTSIGSVSAAEIARLDGVTSPIQTQLNAKAPTNSPSFTGTVSLPAATSIGSVSSTEVSRLDGVTSGIQSQLNAKAAAGLHSESSTRGEFRDPTTGFTIKWGRGITSGTGVLTVNFTALGLTNFKNANYSVTATQSIFGSGSDRNATIKKNFSYTASGFTVGIEINGQELHWIATGFYL